MIEVVSNCIHDLMLLFTDFLSRMFGSNSLSTNYIIPGIMIGVGVAVLFVAIKIIKKIVWGS